MAPAPMIAMRLGWVSSVIAARLPMTVVPLNGRSGSARVAVPVASRSFSAVCVSSLPSAALTTTVFASLNVPSPRR